MMELLRCLLTAGAILGACHALLAVWRRVRAARAELHRRRTRM